MTDIANNTLPCKRANIASQTTRQCVAIRAGNVVDMLGPDVTRETRSKPIHSNFCWKFLGDFVHLRLHIAVASGRLKKLPERKKLDDCSSEVGNWRRKRRQPLDT